MMIPNTCFCHFPIWCPGSGEVFGCIDSKYMFCHFPIWCIGSGDVFGCIDS